MNNQQQRERRLANTRRMSGIRPIRKESMSAKSSLSNNSVDDSHVKVAVRCRPMSEKEINDGYQSIVELESDNRIVIHDVSESPSDHLGTASGERKNYSHVYDFDAVFGPDSTQKQIYDCVCRPIVESVLEGYNGTIFAYGQTGTGKTYTMEGVNQRNNKSNNGSTNGTTIRNNSANIHNHSNQSSAKGERNQAQSSSGGGGGGGKTNMSGLIQSQDDSTGMIPRTFKQIFDHIANNPQIQFLIRASYLEIYQEEIRDLLKKDKNTKLELHERSDIGVYVKDLTSFVCKSITEIERVMRVGNQNRIVGATDMNEHSSRSHAIFMITVEQQQSTTITTSNDRSQNGPMANPAVLSKSGNNKERVIKVGKLNLVDLAGSERQRKTNSFGQRQRESIKINLSLSALGNVINSLMKIHNQELQSSKSGSEGITREFATTATATATTITHTPYRDSKLTRLLQDSLGGNAKTLMIANIGPASYNYDETINTLNYASRARCIRNKPRLNEDPKDALLRELQREIDLLRSKLASTTAAVAINHNEDGLPPTRSTKNKDLIGSNKTKNNDHMIEKELQELKQKLSSLERKLLNGKNYEGDFQSLDQNLLKGYTHEQELELEKHRNELVNQDGRQRAIREELERREEAEMVAKESFNSMQQEVDAKRKLIRQILVKVKSIRDEIDDTQRAYRLELDELDQLQYVLQKELKLKCLIMDNFIPNSHVDQLLARIIYDERRNCCSIDPIYLPIDHCNLNNDADKFTDLWRPTYDSIRPQSEFERMSEAIYPNNIRYKYDNLIEPQLDMPKQEDCRRKLCLMQDDYNGEALAIGATDANMLQSLIDNALNQCEPDIVI